MPSLTSARIAVLVQKVKANTRQQLITLTEERTAVNETKITELFGGPAPWDRVVDATPGKALTEAQFLTHTTFHLFPKVIDAALQMLMERSPVGPEEGGHYRDDHWLFINGTRRDAANEASGEVPILPSDEVVIINMRPYARKIEGGARHRTRRRLTERRPGLSVQAPDGVYEITARDLKNRFGNVCQITFVYRGALGPALPLGPTERSLRYPALQIRSKVGV